MRLAMCLIQDDVKSSYLWCADARTHQELDARNSEVRAQTAFELIADRWNDESFNPIAPPNCHEDFVAVHSLVATMMPACLPTESRGCFDINAVKPSENYPKLGEKWARRGGP
jgi:hypothetical protein